MAEETYDVRELVELILQGMTRANSAGDGRALSLLVRDDGTLRIWSTVVGDSSAGETPIAVEPTGEQKMVLHGKDSDGNVDALRTDDDQRLKVSTISSAMLMAQLETIAEILNKVVFQLSLITDVTL